MDAPTDGPDRTDAESSASRHDWPRLRRGVVAVGLTIFAAISSAVLIVPTFFLPATVPTVVLALGLAELGFGVAALTFVKATDRGVGYVGLELPARGQLVAWGIGGAAVLVAVRSVAARWRCSPSGRSPSSPLSSLAVHCCRHASRRRRSTRRRSCS